MTYQFDPRPEGLHYEAFKAVPCRKAMWYLHDGAPEPWVDLRSVIEALGMNWRRRWDIYCLARRSRWALEACYDRTLRETMLAPANKMPMILNELWEILRPHDSTRYRVRALHAQWRDIRAALLISAHPLPRVTTPRVGARKRKVDAYVVRQAYVLNEKKYTRAAIAKALGVAPGTVQQIIAGRYPLRGDAEIAWWETFGKPQDSPASDFAGCKEAKQTHG